MIVGQWKIPNAKGPLSMPQALNALHRHILTVFADTGRSPTPEELKREFKLPSSSVLDERLAELEQAGCIHRDSGDDRITHAYPFSNDPTPHRVKLNDGPQVYAMCAIDALGIPFMLKTQASVRSTCARCGQPIEITIRNKVVETVQPDGLIVGNASSGSCLVSAVDLCPHLHFFCSRAHLSEWNAMNAGRTAELLSLAEASVWARTSFESLLSTESKACPSGQDQKVNSKEPQDESTH